jgi:phosphatidate cytidylyltransferase
MAKASKQLQLVLSVLSAFCGLVFVVGQFELKVIGLLVFISAMTFGSFRSGKVAIIGSIYLGLSGFAFASLRAHPENGILYIFGLFSVVWATDSAAYAFGRIFKGPKLMPIISPNKTWAGFIGGSLCGMLAASIYSILANLIINPDNLLKTIVPWTLVGLVLTLASQFGDLLESWVKRFFGVKDSSNLIPGHGGILDRLDGHLCAALILAIILAIPGLAEQLT